MNYENKKCDIDYFNETISEEYRRHGLKTKFEYPIELKKGVFENSFSLYENQDYVATVFLGINFLRSEGEIKQIEIIDSIRNKGYENKILSGLENSLQEINIRKIKVIPENKSSELFWKSNNYLERKENLIKRL